MQIDENTPGSLANQEAVGVFLLRYGCRFIDLPKIAPIGLLRYGTLFALISVIMSGARAAAIREPVLRPPRVRAAARCDIE
jgi:hypothetical protein